jgi:hypothetical protein
MTTIAEIALEQYSAVASWSPIPSHPDIVALGSKVRAQCPCKQKPSLVTTLALAFRTLTVKATKAFLLSRVVRCCPFQLVYFS